MQNPLEGIDPKRFHTELARLEALETAAVRTLATSIKTWIDSGQLRPLTDLPWFRRHRRHRFYGEAPTYTYTVCAVVRDDGQVFIWKRRPWFDSLHPWVGQPSAYLVAESLYNYAHGLCGEMKIQHRLLLHRLNAAREWNLNPR